MSASRPIALAALVLVPACASNPAWNLAEKRHFAATLHAIGKEFAAEPAALAENDAVDLPEGAGLDLVDERLHVYAPGDAGHETEHPLFGPDQKRQLPSLLVRGEAGVALAVAGTELTGFDSVQDFAIGPQTGLVLLATRRGVQTLATPNGNWSGNLWRADLLPQFSTDGSHFVFVQEGMLNDRSMIAPSATPEKAVPLDFGCRVHWPVWPGRDGSRVRAIVENEGRIEVRDAGKVVAFAESYAHAVFDAPRDQLRVHLTTGKKTIVLIGDRQTPALDDYRLPVVSADGQHYAVIGRDGGEDVLVVDGNTVLRHARLVAAALSADGSTWAAAAQEGEQGFVVRATGKSGPMPPVTELRLAPDGSSLAALAGGSWTVDGEPLVGYDEVRDLQPLPAKAGAVFAGRDAAGWWLVAPGQRDGPWERLERIRLLDDGKHLLGLAQRGRQAHRRVLTLTTPHPHPAGTAPGEDAEWEE